MVVDIHASDGFRVGQRLAAQKRRAVEEVHRGAGLDRRQVPTRDARHSWQEEILGRKDSRTRYVGRAGNVELLAQRHERRETAERVAVRAFVRNRHDPGLAPQTLGHFARADRAAQHRARHSFSSLAGWSSGPGSSMGPSSSAPLDLRSAPMCMPRSTLAS
jgi:hypothetical protein